MFDELLWSIKFWVVGILTIISIPFLLIWGLVVELPIKLGKSIDAEG